ncbi:MAG: hypothetical protein ACLTER_07510 [Ruminococcus sp.]
MQKYKKWKQVLSVSTAVSLCIAGAGSLMGCGSTDRGKDKADSVESKAMGRYLENELSVPEGCMEDCGFAGYERGKPENACKKQ